MEELLKRYDEKAKKVINDYWEKIRWTRSTGKVSDGIKKRELEFWKKFEVWAVVKALEIHISNYPNIKEHYTRGIIKNVSNGGNMGEKSPAKPPIKNKFANFKQRDLDFDEIERLAQSKLK